MNHKFARKLLTVFLSVGICIFAFPADILACTGIYAGSAVTENGSVYVGRSEDFGPDFAKQFMIIPAADHEPGEYLEDDYGFKAPYPSHTLRYSVIMDDPSEYSGLTKIPFAEAGINEKGVSVSATVSTYFNKKVLDTDPLTQGGITEISMASYILQSAVTARDGVGILAECIDTYGHGSSDPGNPDYAEVSTVLIADRDETWVFEVLSGHQYAATRLSDDTVSVLPNVIMTQQINVSDEDIVASDGLISTAKKGGFYVSDVEGEEEIHVGKSYSEGYNAYSSYRFYYGAFILNRELAEMTDAVPRPVSETVDLYPNASVEEEAAGPFYLQYQPSGRVSGKISLMTLRDVLASHGEGTLYETTSHDENAAGELMRSIGTYRQNEEHIFEIRKDPSVPLSVSTIEWLALAPSEFSIYVPFYAGAMTETPDVYTTDTPESFNPDSVYWLFNEIGCAGNGSYYRAGEDGLYRDRNGQVIDSSKAEKVLQYLEDQALAEELRKFMKTTQEELGEKFAADDKAIVELAMTGTEEEVAGMADRLAEENAELVKEIVSKKLSEIDEMAARAEKPSFSFTEWLKKLFSFS